MNDQDEMQNNGAIRQGPGVIGKVLRLILRLAFLLLVGAGLGAAAYFGAPKVYRDVIMPVEQNTQRIGELQDSIEALSGSQGDQRVLIEERLAQLEHDNAVAGEAIAELRADLAALQGDVSAQAERLETLDAFSAELTKLALAQSAVEAELSDLIESMADEEAPLQRVERQLQLIRVMEILTRARLWLIADNLGLAEDDLNLAHEALGQVVLLAPAEEAAGLMEVLDRIDLARASIRRAPAIAADDLEIAWRLLQDATSIVPGASNTDT